MIFSILGHFKPDIGVAISSKYLISVSHHSFIKQKQHRLKAYVSAAYQFLMGPKPTSVPKVVTLIAPIFLLCDKLR